MVVSLDKKEVARITDVNRLEKLAEGQYANIISNTNPQHLLASMFYRIYDGTGYKKEKTLFQKAQGKVKNPPVVRYGGTESAKQVETAFSENPDKSLLRVWNSFNNAQLSYLSPYINFFSRITDSGGKLSYKSIPLQSVHPTINIGSKEEQMLGRSNAIFGFLGLKSVDIELAGKYEETKYSDVKVEVTFAGNTLHIMDNEDYLPLVVPHDSKNNMMGHQLLMEYGYNDISPSAKKNLKFTNQQVKEIKGQKTRFILYYYKHDFNIQQDGSFTLKVNYIARASEQLRSIDLGMPQKKDFEALYGNRRYSLGEVDDDFDSQIYKYIEDTHPSADEEQRAIIRNYFYAMRKGKKSEVTTLFKTRKQAVVNLAFGKLKEIPALLRHNGLEFAFAMPEWNRQAYFIKCAVISAHLDMMARSEPHPLESNFANLYSAATSNLALVSPNPRVINRKSFYDYAAIAFSDVNPGGQLDGESIFKTPSYVGHTRAQAYHDAVNAYTTSYFTKTKTVSKYKSAGQVVSSAEEGEDLVTRSFSVGTVEGKLDSPKYFTGATFYKLGDLLQAFMLVTNGTESFSKDNISVFLGTCRVRNRFHTVNYSNYFSARKKQERFVPLYDIPIENSEFINMLNENFINKSTAKITFMAFFEGLMSIVRKYYLVGDAITQSRLNHPSRGVTMDLVTTTLQNGQKIAKDSATSLSQIKKTDFKKMSAKGIGKLPDSDGVYSLFVINAGATAPSPKKKGENEKVYDSYYIGSEFSVVKRAKFNRVQTATQKATESDNVAAAMEDETGGLIPHLYNVDIDIIGNVKFTPGYYFNLKPFAPKLKIKKPSTYASGGILKKLGLDNLNVTLTVNHRIDSRGFNTSLRSMAVVKNK